MSLHPGLFKLGQLMTRLEPNIHKVLLTILTHEDRELIARSIMAGLLGEQQDNKKVKIETSSGEYTNQLAILQVNQNKYMICSDHRGEYISSINYFTCRITPDASGILVYHTDSPGVVHDVSRILADHKINIFTLHVSREQKGKRALLVSLTDEPIPPAVLSSIEQLEEVKQVVPL